MNNTWAMKRLSDIRIGKKMALVLGAGVLQLVCIGSLALWSVRSIDNAVSQLQHQNDAQVQTQQVMNDVSRLFVGVGGIVISNRQGGDQQSAVLALRKEYREIIANLLTHAENEEERRLMSQLDQSTAPWRQADNLVMKLALAGKKKEAAVVYREQALPCFEGVIKAVQSTLVWRKAKVGEINQYRQLLTARVSLALLISGVFVLAFTAAFTMLIAHSITKPLKATIEHIGEIAGGDISRDVPVNQLERRDEIGLLAKSMQTMAGSLRVVLQDISGGIALLSSSSAELSRNSNEMSQGSHVVSDKAHSVAAAAEQMSTNVAVMASSLDQTAASLTSVASATTQMNTVVGEIAVSSGKSRLISDKATHQVARISEQMSQLAEAIQAIGKITETITEISSQTNLLALNATIEAARAGVAGKGFAVVASEVKALAAQTAAATQDITSRIALVQTSAASGTAEINKISQVIQEVGDTTISIAAAIEEQSVAISDIARSIAETSTGVREANDRLSEASYVTKEIAGQIAGVDLSAKQMSDNSHEVRSSVADLSKVAQQLDIVVSRFRVA